MLLLLCFKLLLSVFYQHEWNFQLTSVLSIFCCDETKAFLQVNEKASHHICSPFEFYRAYPYITNHFWRVLIQVYGKVEAGLCWCRTVLPWIIEHSSGLQYSFHDLSMLFSRTRMLATLFITNDKFVAILEPLLSKDAAIAKGFDCRTGEFPPVDFKDRDLRQEKLDFIIF